MNILIVFLHLLQTPLYTPKHNEFPQASLPCTVTSPKSPQSVTFIYRDLPAPAAPSSGSPSRRWGEQRPLDDNSNSNLLGGGMDVGGWGGGPYADFQCCVMLMIIPGFPGRPGKKNYPFLYRTDFILFHHISSIRHVLIVTIFFIILVFLPGKD